jgi:hypothetical protein
MVEKASEELANVGGRSGTKRADETLSMISSEALRSGSG